jgi:hypothetical protein
VCACLILIDSSSSMTLKLALTHSYDGPFASQVKELLAQGIRVYRMHVSGGNYVRCHVCPANFLPPTQPVGQMESLSKCPGCQAVIVFLHLDKVSP